VAVKKRGLGRGLDALLGATARPQAVEAAPGEVHAIPVHKIRRSRFQPRADISAEALQDLAASIRAQGVVQPVVLRTMADGEFELIAGERRWRAAQIAGLDEIPAVVRDVPDQAALAIALIENIQREDLSPLEEANALQRLAEEFELTHQEVAEAVGRSRVAVTNLLRLLELPAEVKRMLQERQIEMGHARALLGLKEVSQQIDAARRVVSKGLSVRETEVLIRRLQGGQTTGGRERRADPDVLRLQDDLSQRLGASVTLQPGQKGKGKLVIHYNSLEELDGILLHIR
jgi:ParB family transcriptional regulator, chromosome partitioning protein